MRKLLRIRLERTVGMVNPRVSLRECKQFCCAARVVDGVDGEISNDYSEQNPSPRPASVAASVVRCVYTHLL